MFTARNSRPQVEERPRVITADTLKDAYRKVRLLHGENAVIQSTRTVTAHTGNGLGTKKMVEVTVGETGANAVSPTVRRTAGRRAGAPPAAEVAQELDRLDTLVAEVQTELERAQSRGRARNTFPALAFLETMGASRETTELLARRFRAETGAEPRDRDAFLGWLGARMSAAECDWDGFYGSHAFLGLDRRVRQDLVFDTCARFRELGREVLLLVAFPEDEGTISRLQREAAGHGYDAAVIRRAAQFQSCREHFGQYDVVLLELPDLDDPILEENPEVRAWLADNAGFHRHMVVSLDADLAAAEAGPELARKWNCDWVAVTRSNRFRREGKLLDVLEAIPLPVSLDRTGGKVSIARAADLAARLKGVTGEGAGAILAAVTASARSER